MAMHQNIRADNPIGTSLLDRSTAHPGNIDKSIFEKKPSNQVDNGSGSDHGTVNPRYLQECREDNPDPAAGQDQTKSVTLGCCMITTPSENLVIDQPFEMSVEAMSTDGQASGQVSFHLFCTIPDRAGGPPTCEDQSLSFSGKMFDGLAKASGKLISPRTPVATGTKLLYHVVAAHPEAKEKCESPKVEVECGKPPKPLAAWSLGAVHFGFDSCFILPSAAAEIADFKAKLEEHPGAALAVFGHADPVGEDDSNKGLSGRRAFAVWCLLAKDPTGWTQLANSGKWDLRTTQTMLAHLKEKASGQSYYRDDIDGRTGPNTETAIRTFRADHSLGNGTSLDAKSKEALYKAYMESVCEVTCKPEDFVGDPKDAKRQWGCVGCSEFNPVLVFGKADDARFRNAMDKTERDAKNAPNRRATVFLFPPGAKGAGNVDFPCPAWSDGAENCRKRFFEDAEKRRTPSDTERTWDGDKDTFGCEFYAWLVDQESIPETEKQDANPTITTLYLGIFNDGTGNDWENDINTDSVSNVGKLYQLYPTTTDGSERWERRYVRGIGTDRAINSLKQGFAIGFESRIDDTLRWLQGMVTQYPNADLKLQIFGFSRGAAISRAFVNELSKDKTRRKYELAKTKIEVELLALFDTVGSVGIPGNGVDLGIDLTVHASRIKKVIHLVAQSEVRGKFDLWSIRCPPNKQDSMEAAPEDWGKIRNQAQLPNADWEEWILPGMHSDVGGGYGQEEWIPDSPAPEPLPGEDVNEYVYRVLDGRMDNGATPRGWVSNTTESKAEVLKRVKKRFEHRHRKEMRDFERVHRSAQAAGQPGASPEPDQSNPVLDIPGVRCLTNDLSRLALEVMKDRTAAAGVRWKALSVLGTDYQPWFASLPPDHPVQQLVELSADLNRLESTLQTESDLFRKAVADHFHDSRCDPGLSRRKRDVFFGGRNS